MPAVICYCLGFFDSVSGLIYLIVPYTIHEFYNIPNFNFNRLIPANYSTYEGAHENSTVCIVLRHRLQCRIVFWFQVENKLIMWKYDNILRCRDQPFCLFWNVCSWSAACVISSRTRCPFIMHKHSWLVREFFFLTSCKVDLHNLILLSTVEANKTCTESKSWVSSKPIRIKRVPLLNLVWFFHRLRCTSFFPLCHFAKEQITAPHDNIP